MPFLIRRSTGVLTTLALVLFNSVVSAQEDADTAPPAPEERTIYVPYSELGGVFENLGAGVIMPYDEWLKLWREEEPAERAVDAVITAASYTATVEKDLARIRAELTVNVLGEPWAEVPIRFGDAAVGSVEGDAEDVLLRGTGDGTYSLLLGKSGEQHVVLELVARVRTSPDGRDFTFATPAVGITNFELLIPEADQTVEITPRLVNLPVENQQAAGETHVRASLGSTNQITARWHPRASVKPEMELLSSVTNHTQVSVEDGLIHTDAYLTYDVLRGSLNEIRIAVPADHQILDVSSNPSLKGWRTEEGDGVQTLIVEMLSGVEGQVTVEVHTERPQPADPFPIAGRTAEGAVAGIHALDAVRESGQIVLRHGSDLTITLTEQQGVVRIPMGEAAERIRSEGGLAFKYFNPQFTLIVEAKPVEPRIVVQQATQLVFDDDELRLQAGLTYTVERAGIFQLLLNVPEEVVIDDVQCAQMKEYSFDDQTRVLTISLLEKTQGQIGVNVTGHRDYEAGVDAGEINLPTLEPQGVERETGAIYVFAKEAIEVVTNEEGLEAAQPLPAPAGQQVGEAQLTAAWSYTRRPVTIPVTTERKAARMNVNVATTLDVQPKTVGVNTQLDFVVQFAGIDTFQFMLPEAYSESAQIEAVATDPSSPDIKQKTPSDPADGWVTWTVVMQRPVVGTQRFLVTYDIRSAEEDAEAGDADAGDGDADAGAESDEIAVELLRPLAAPAPEGGEVVPISQLRGEVAVTKDQSLAVTAKAEGGDAEEIDVRELALLPKSGALAYHFFDQPDDAAIVVTLTRTRHEIEEVVDTVVSRMLVEIVNGEDGMALYDLRMRLKSTQRQRLLIDLPANLELLHVIVDGREVKLERAGEAVEGALFQSHYLNVARTRPSDQEFFVNMRFRWQVPRHLGESQYVRGPLELPLPILGGENSPAAVQQLRVAVWVPRDFALVGEPEHFVLEGRTTLGSALFGLTESRPTVDLNRWINDGGSSLSGVQEGHNQYVYSTLGYEPRIHVIWWNRVWMTWIVSGAIALLALLLGGTSWENKILWLLLAGFAAAMIGFWDSHWLAHALAVSRYGLAFLIGWWLVRGLFHSGRTIQPAPGTAAAVTTESGPPGSAAKPQEDAGEVAEQGPASEQEATEPTSQPEAPPEEPEKEESPGKPEDSPG